MGDTLKGPMSLISCGRYLRHSVIGKLHSVAFAAQAPMHCCTSMQDAGAITQSHNGFSTSRPSEGLLPLLNSDWNDSRRARGGGAPRRLRLVRSSGGCRRCSAPAAAATTVGQCIWCGVVDVIGGNWAASAIWTGSEVVADQAATIDGSTDCLTASSLWPFWILTQPSSSPTNSCAHACCAATAAHMPADTRCVTSSTSSYLLHHASRSPRPTHGCQPLVTLVHDSSQHGRQALAE